MLYNAIAIGLLAVGFVIGFWQMKLLEGKEIIWGRVIERPEGRSNKGGSTYGIVAEFKDRAGNSCVYRSGWKSSNPGYRIGDPIKIYFNRINPADCGVCSFGIRFGAAFIFIVLGLAVLCAIYGYKFGRQWMDNKYPVTIGSTLSR